ncbi:hypothetical protein T4E_4349 [Trichinella pseudospiralis]|uniref:Uncharacterized protein n=1 Tax=Trichinella pseudospiralis TaxID=6337 RepID=A0A0V0XK51_TRIPS|nr:hypothetical protein T4E_4349 [Trichinella pseudospiralis]
MSSKYIFLLTFSAPSHIQLDSILHGGVVPPLPKMARSLTQTSKRKIRGFLPSFMLRQKNLLTSLSSGSSRICRTIFEMSA